MNNEDIGYKPGGANKDQPYRKSDGEYINKNYDDLVYLSKVLLSKNKFGIYNVRFPEYNRNDTLYCILYVNNILKIDFTYFPTDKVVKYLLVPKEKDDKCHFFELHGYNLKNWKELYDQLINNVRFDLKTFNKITKHGLFIYAPTHFYDKLTNSRIEIKTIWMIDKKSPKTAKFITAILKKEKKQ